MSGAADNQAAIRTPSLKPLAWEGVSLAVPLGWDLGAYRGDHRHGTIRIDAGPRPEVARLHWWTARRSLSTGEVLDKVGAGRGKSRRWKQVAVAADVPAEVFEHGGAGAALEWAIIARDQRDDRTAVLHAPSNNGLPTRRDVEAIALTLRSQRLDAWRDWAFYGWHFQSPPGVDLEEASVAAGVSSLLFSGKLGRLRLSRYSAADAVMRCAFPSERDFEAWARHAYASERGASHYEFRQEASDETGRRRLRFIRRGGYWRALEIRGFIPRRRRLPAEIRLTWDSTVNKIYGCEVFGRPEAWVETLEALERSGGMTVDDSCIPSPLEYPETASPQIRLLRSSLLANHEVKTEPAEGGRLVLCYEKRRPGGLRILRLLAGESTGPLAVTQRLELDLVGSLAWQKCQRGARFDELIEFVRRRFQITWREAEVSVSGFVHSLARRGLLKLSSAHACEFDGSDS